jgi:hypothetical protein
MNSKERQILNEKYKLVREDNDTVSAAGGDLYASTQPPKEIEVALDWKIAGLYEPETPEEQKVCSIALKELSNITQRLETELNTWGEKYKSLGANDTLSKETVAQYIAKGVLGLTQLD